MEELSLQMGLQAGAQYTIGYTAERGRGSLTILGLSPSADLLLALHENLSLHAPTRSLTPHISTALFRRDQEFYLIAVNNGEQTTIADVILDHNLLKKSHWKVCNLVSRQEWTIDLHENGHLIFPVSRKDGVILHLQSV